MSYVLRTTFTFPKLITIVSIQLSTSASVKVRSDALKLNRYAIDLNPAGTCFPDKDQKDIIFPDVYSQPAG